MCIRDRYSTIHCPLLLGVVCYLKNTFVYIHLYICYVIQSLMNENIAIKEEITTADCSDAQTNQVNYMIALENKNYNFI